MIKSNNVVASIIKTTSILLLGLFNIFCLIGIINIMGFYNADDYIIQFIIMWVIGNLTIILVYGIGEIVDLLDKILRK